MGGGPDGSNYLAVTDLFDLSANQDGELSLQPWHGWVPNDEIAGVPVGGQAPNRLAFCRDHLGTHYRFTPYEPTQTWREGSGTKPRWVEFYLSHFEDLKKT